MVTQADRGRGGQFLLQQKCNKFIAWRQGNLLKGLHTYKNIHKHNRARDVTLTWLPTTENNLIHIKHTKRSHTYKNTRFDSPCFLWEIHSRERAPVTTMVLLGLNDNRPSFALFAVMKKCAPWDHDTICIRLHVSTVVRTSFAVSWASHCRCRCAGWTRRFSSVSSDLYREETESQLRKKNSGTWKLLRRASPKKTLGGLWKWAKFIYDLVSLRAGVAGTSFFPWGGAASLVIPHLREVEFL